jgi:hypothetical protein
MIEFNSAKVAELSSLTIPCRTCNCSAAVSPPENVFWYQTADSAPPHKSPYVIPLSSVKTESGDFRLGESAEVLFNSWKQIMTASKRAQIQADAVRTWPVVREYSNVHQLPYRRNFRRASHQHPSPHQCRLGRSTVQATRHHSTKADGSSAGSS